MALEPTSGTAEGGWISAPLSSLAPRTRALVVAGATLAASGYAAWKELHYRSPTWLSDVGWYTLIAQGRAAEVQQPFVSRQLGPLVARALAALLHLGTLPAFYLEAGVALLVIVGVVFALAARTRAPWWILAAIAVAPMLPDTMLGLLLPDLFYSALLAILLILLERELWLLAALWMLPLMVARESTTLTLLCLLAAAWRPLRWRGRALAVISAGAGAAIVHHLTRFSPGNAQHLPESLYILLKVPWNAAQNLFGLQLWNNVNNTCPVPAWQHPVHLGAIRAVGFCGVNPALPRATAMALLTEFGLLPLLLCFVLGRRRQHPAEPAAALFTSVEANGRSTMLRFAALYGTACFLLGPLLGTGVSRLMGYGWPLFFVVLPVWLGEAGWLRSRRATWAAPLFLAAHWAISWVYWRWQYTPEIVLLWAGTAALLWFWSGARATPSATPPEMGSKPTPQRA